MPYRLVLLLLFAALPALAQGVEAPPRPPNVLWILGEDLGPELGAYHALGNELATGVRTPNLDGLARRGQLYTHAFTTSPVCSPSRSAFHTGMYQTTIGAHNHRSHRVDDPSPYPWPLPDSVRVVTDWLRHRGYFTGNIRTFPEGVVTADGEPLRGTGKTDWNFTYSGRPFDTDRWSDLEANQPFFAEVNFPETHRGRAWDTSHERIPNPATPEAVVLPPYYPDAPVMRQVWAQYLNAVMSLDHKVGLVLEQLEADGLAGNTVVVFMGDHGRAMVRGKQWPYDSGLHVPLIVYVPDAVRERLAGPGGALTGYAPGAVSDELVAAIDVTATTLALAGLPKPEAMQGQVLIGEQRAAPRTVVFGGRDRGDETVDRIRTARTHRFRYLRNFHPEKPFFQQNLYKETQYPEIWEMRQLRDQGRLTPEQAYLFNETRPREELYDVLADPYEVDNLAGDPAYGEILGQLRAEVEAWIERTGDQGRIPEDPSVARHYDERMHEWYDERLEERRRALPEIHVGTDHD